MTARILFSLLTFGLFLAFAEAARADRLELTDGTVIENCILRDDAVEILMWRTLDEVGGPPTAVYPRSAVKSIKIERGDEWDAHPNLPDLSVTFIEMNPKLAGLHGRVQYDTLGRPKIGGAPALVELGDRAYREPERVVQGLKLAYEPGEEITLTAHVKNVGFAPSGPFTVTWRIDGREIDGGRFADSLGEMEETTFTTKWRWEPGEHTVRFAVQTEAPEIATRNNVAEDPLWGMGLVFVTHPKRVELWHQNRTAYGTFSFEDFYRWHLDLMNKLFARSVYPATPEGIRARVRLDRIVYTEDVEAEMAGGFAEDGIRYDQGRWIWIDDGDRKGDWKPPTKEWRNQTEWSLPHELGHQLGLVDLYGLDEPGNERHVWPDNGAPVTHFMTEPFTMMHWHGPNLWSEIHAAYLNATFGKPRGHYGDFYFAIPRENVLRVLDINGRGLANATVEIFQRGVQIDPNGEVLQIDGATVYPVVEDGNFGPPVSAEPVIVGTTDTDGRFRLPNRPVAEVRTLNGYERKPNPFGNMDVVGRRGLLLVRLTVGEKATYYWLEITDFVVAVHRGQKDRFAMTLETPYPSPDSPPPPENVVVERIDENRVRVRWEPPSGLREQHVFDRIVGYRVYRRISNDGLNDRPWFPVATVGPDAREAVVDLRDVPDDLYYYSKVNRFGVATIRSRDIQSGLTEALLPEKE